MFGEQCWWKYFFLLSLLSFFHHIFILIRIKQQQFVMSASLLSLLSISVLGVHQAEWSAARQCNSVRRLCAIKESFLVTQQGADWSVAADPVIALNRPSYSTERNPGVCCNTAHTRDCCQVDTQRQQLKHQQWKVCCLCYKVAHHVKLVRGSSHNVWYWLNFSIN